MTYGTLKDNIAGAAWTAFTPTLTNTTLGNGTITGFYTQVGKTVFAKVKFTLGSTSAVASNPLIIAPVAFFGSGMSSSAVVGICSIFKSPTTYLGIVKWNTSTNGLLLVYLASGTYVAETAITATVPVTFATGDSIDIFLHYEAT